MVNWKPSFGPTLIPVQPPKKPGLRCMFEDIDMDWIRLRQLVFGRLSIVRSCEGGLAVINMSNFNWMLA